MKADAVHKTVLWLVFFFTAITAYGQDEGIPRDTQAIQSVVDALFDGMREKDAAKIERQFHTDARLGNLAAGDFARRVSESEAYLDEVTFDETILIDGDLAMAWTPYNLFVDEQFHHCGVDLFVMKRTEGRWLISQLEDTRRTEGCDPTRRE